MRLSSERAEADETDDEGDMFNAECLLYLSGTRLRSEGVGVPDDAREGERRQTFACRWSLVSAVGLQSCHMRVHVHVNIQSNL